MLEFAARIAGAETVMSQLTSLTPQIKGRVKNAIQNLTTDLLRHVKEDKLSGQVLKNQTGTLRRSINQKITEMDGAVIGSVGTNLSYARAHEFGVDMTMQVTVREHMRRVKSRDTSFVLRAFNGDKMRNRTMDTLGTTVVHSFQRNQHIKLPERSFLRSAMDDMRPEIRQQLVQAFRGMF